MKQILDSANIHLPWPAQSSTSRLELQALGIRRPNINVSCKNRYMFPGIPFQPSFKCPQFLAMSIPVLIAYIKPYDQKWQTALNDYDIAYYSLTVAFNIFVAVMICIRFYMMRQKLETVMGTLHAAFYTSTVTMFVESGAFFTLWATAYLIMRCRGTVVREIFLLAYTHILVRIRLILFDLSLMPLFEKSITRMLIILRIAQDKAWSRDLVAATDRGVLDWQVSSTHSVPLHDIPASSISMVSFNSKILPRKFQDDAAMM